ncbi:MAG: MerR family DNA-binding transcriptional regulator [Acidimicrobiia bacterium]|nr:MerR family DNA-binding transcriptional regulator [Acidimicrobiia bacterium]
MTRISGSPAARVAYALLRRGRRWGSPRSTGCEPPCGHPKPSRALKVKGSRVRSCIGELSERSGVPTKTIRYWEQSGLVAEPARTGSGYRDLPRRHALGVALRAIRAGGRLHGRRDRADHRHPLPVARRHANTSPP